MSGSLALHIDNLSYHYRSNWTYRAKAALHNISLDVREGETFGFLGHNGAGKTTTIKCILGLVRPSAGNIYIFDAHYNSPRARSQVGYVPEHPYFYEHLTVQESMLMYACLANAPSSQRRELVAKALDRVHLHGRENSRLRTLSKGLMQRLAMAQAIVHRPKLLILDEPFSGLDPIGRREFRELLVELKEEGATIFMSSHILSDVEFLCDRVSIMAHGRLKGVFETKRIPDTASGYFELIIRVNQTGPGTPNEILSLAASSRKEDRFLRLSFSERTSAEAALRLSIEHNLGVESFELIHGNLEDLFMRLVSQEGGG